MTTTNETTTTTTETIVSVRCRAMFSSLMVYRIAVDTDGTCRVFDHVTGQWTARHSLSDRALRTARKLAEAARCA